MSENTEQFIARMKLRELREQRDQLRATYAELQKKSTSAATLEEQLQLLYEGLREIKLTQTSLHPDVENLDVLLQRGANRAISDELLKFWLARLQTELATGQLRAEFVYLFGALLEEWATGKQAVSAPSREQEQASQTLRAKLAETPADVDPDEVLKPFFTFLEWQISQNHSDQAELYETLDSPVWDEEASTVLKHLEGSLYRSAAIRSEAKRYLANEDARRELVDALTILISHIEEWRWPEDGVPCNIVEAGHRWRLFLDEEFPMACLLEIMGLRLNQYLKRQLITIRGNRLARLTRLRELNAPDIILENEERLMREEWGRVTDGDMEHGDGSATLTPDPYSVVAKRLAAQHELRNITLLDRYSGEQSTSAMETALALINAEIELHRAAYPESPLYILKVDIQDFYASINHNVLEKFLPIFKLPGKYSDFISRYLRVPIRFGNTVVKTGQGIPNDRVLSNWLAELVMLALDRYILSGSYVQIVRLVDDICIISPSGDKAVAAWKAIQEFCKAVGLTVNASKTGSVTINGEAVSELPEGSPKWMTLLLDTNGQWHVNQTVVAEYTARIRQQLEQASTTLARVELYNNGLQYLKDNLAFGAFLGETHRREINDALLNFHAHLFDPNQSIVRKITDGIRQKFGLENFISGIPEAWLYWPLTAGGLGLKQTAVITASYTKATEYQFRILPPKERGANWEYVNNGWCNFYDSRLRLVQPAAPAPTKILETLVTDFIARGSLLTSGRQHNLGFYWRWIVYTFGPQILERFGSFRFLITELVPMQLIQQRRIGSDEAELE